MTGKEESPLPGLPAGWVECPVGDVGNLVRGVTYKKEQSGKVAHKNMLPILRANNISGRLVFEDLVYVQQSLVKPEQIIQEDDIIFAMSSGSKKHVGKSAIATQSFNGSFGAFCGLLRSNTSISAKYLSCYFSSNEFRRHIEEISKGTNINNLKREHVLGFVFRLPPTNEQHRIVAKIEELFSELDKGIESLKTAREQLKVYRQAVLKHAFEGKLTAQWREENKSKLETADQLLARIQKEREARYQQQLEEWHVAVVAWEKKGKEGKKPAKPKKYLPSILNESERDALQVIPEGWLWVRFSELLYSIRGGTTVPPIDKETKFPILRSSSVRTGDINYADVRYIIEEKIKSKQDFVEEGDILFSRLNGTIEFVGNCAAVGSGFPENLIYPDRLYCTKLVDKSLVLYSEYYFSSPSVRRHIEEKAKSTAGHKRISIPDITDSVFRLPSVDEAKIIASHLEEQFSVIRKSEQDIEVNCRVPLVYVFF